MQVGIVMGCFAIGLLISRPWLARTADRRSRKLAVAIGAIAVGSAPLGYMAVQSIPLLMLFRGLHGLSIAGFTTGYSALVVDSSPPQRKGEIIGYMSLVVPVGMAIGPALGGWLQSSVGYVPLFAMSASAGFLALLLSVSVAESPREALLTDESQANATPRENFFQAIVSPRIQTPAAVLLLVGLAFGTIATFLPLFIESLAFSFNAGLYYSVFAIASFIGRVFFGKASDRYGRGLFLSCGLGGYWLALCLLATAQTPTSILLAAVAQGIGGGTIIPMTVALMADRSTDRERARVYSLCLTGFDVGIAIAGPLFGSLSEVLGYRGLFTVGIGLATLALTIFFTRSSKDIPHSLRFALGRAGDAYAIGQTKT